MLRWYTIACHVTKQTRALRHRALASQQDDKDSRSEEEDHKKSDEKRGRRGRRRRRYELNCIDQMTENASSSQTEQMCITILNSLV